MPARKPAKPAVPATSTAIVVLGMHRSGTSALAQLLHAAGADTGERLVPGSAGNEQGHWEDAFAVETNERLLDALGRRWDDVRPLPPDWATHAAAREARARIVEYVRDTRLRHRAWAIKDPRMCLLAELWLAAIREAGAGVCALLLARHPREVAASLAARDGMADAQAQLLWMRHMVEAGRATRELPRLALTFGDLLAAPAGVLASVRALPGCDVLAPPPSLDGVVRAAQRHHEAGGAVLAPAVDAIWRAFPSGGPAAPDAALLEQGAAALASADALYAPVLSEFERTQALLWQRTARAEAALADGLLESAEERRSIAAIGGDMAAGFERVVAAISDDLVRMQSEHAQSLASASELAGQAALARELVPLVEQLRGSLLGDLRAAQGEAGAARMEAATAREEARAAQEAARMEAATAREEARAAQEAARMSRDEARVSRETAAAARRDAEAAQEQARAAQADARAAAGLAAQREAELATQAEALAQLRHRLPVLEAESELLRQVRASRSWRMTRPLRFGARLLRGNATDEDFAKLRRWWARRLASLPLLPRAYRERKWREGRGVARVAADPAGDPVASAPASLAPRAAAAGDKPDVFMWAVIDWHFRTQRPQHLARGLAEDGHRVFYLSNNLVDAPGPGFRVEALDDSGRLFQVFLHAAGAPAIYHANPTAATAAQLLGSVGELMQWADSEGGLCIVQHPFWREVASRVPGTALVYDCMDHHAGFGDNAPEVVAAEAALAREADLLVVTSEWLDRECADANANRALVRNACDFDHFRSPPAERYRDRQGRRIIGYYGAIADWFDVELVRAVARANPECLVLLVGNDTAGAGGKLAGEPNVTLVGEVPYDRLPYYLYAFDVALLPFQVIPLTLATNPVKVYEYLAAGKPVVAVELPEMVQFGDLVYRAEGHAAFLAQLRCALGESSPGLAKRRRAFASGQTWVHRAEELDAAIAALPEPLVSVVVLTFNNLAFTRACLESLERETRWRNLEVIVVDNASTDGTRAFLREWEGGGAGRRVILNEENLGFAAGNNVGLAAARGDYLVLLNNDTYATPNWVRTMVNHLARDPGIGILGPVTNNIGNEARIEIQYADMAEMRRAAAAHTRRHAGVLRDIPTVAFFCVAMPRSTYERIGPMDEAFGVGFFEDDDYCRRVQAAGLRVACAEDVFIHHHLSASFDALAAERKRELFERNRAIYEAKWGAWTPHAYRDQR